MHIVALLFFSAAFLLSMGVIAQMIAANRGRILDALMMNAPVGETRPPAQIYQFPVRGQAEVAWRKAA